MVVLLEELGTGSPTGHHVLKRLVQTSFIVFCSKDLSSATRNHHVLKMVVDFQGFWDCRCFGGFDIYHKNPPNVGKYTIHGWYGKTNGSGSTTSREIQISCRRTFQPAHLTTRKPRINGCSPGRKSATSGGIEHVRFLTTWWFQTFFIYTPTWGNDAILLIFFTWVETTNQLSCHHNFQLLHSCMHGLLYCEPFFFGTVKLRR